MQGLTIDDIEALKESGVHAAVRTKTPTFSHYLRYCDDAGYH